MSTIKYHTKCPTCASLGKDNHADNLGVYSDGHEWCFSCGYYKSGSRLLETKERLKKENKETSNDLGLPLSLPDDTRSMHPCVENMTAFTWLASYELTLDQIIDNFVYSPINNWLIYQIRDHDNKLVFFQARNFNKPPKPKYISHGSIPNWHVRRTLTPTNTLVIVEDIVSAIKLSKFCNALCLFGSGLSRNRLTELALWCKLIDFKGIYWWLDRDKNINNHYCVQYFKSLNLPTHSMMISGIQNSSPKEMTYQRLQNLWFNK